SSSNVKSSTKSLAGLTATVKPSVATRNSVHSIPASSRASISSCSIPRDALANCAEPSINALKPDPVPLPPSSTATPWSALKSSTKRLSIGNTVDEPSPAICSSSSFTVPVTSADEPPSALSSSVSSSVDSSVLSSVPSLSVPSSVDASSLPVSSSDPESEQAAKMNIKLISSAARKKFFFIAKIPPISI